jgi:hypothetical protein
VLARKCNFAFSFKELSGNMKHEFVEANILLFSSVYKKRYRGSEKECMAAKLEWLNEERGMETKKMYPGILVV